VTVGGAGDRSPEGGRPAEKRATRIRLSLGQAELRATLLDTPAARDFAAMLPLTLTLVDYAGTEKVSDLPARLPTHGSPPGAAARAGDICFYAPWGNLAIFYRDGGYATGLVRLGRFDAGVEQLAALSGAVPVTIAAAP
jgi:hypothetical protein